LEKRRVRLEINGIVCGLITQESDEYMKALSDEVGGLMREVMVASPYITREAAALTAALSCCDDAKKNGRKAASLQERVDELEVEAELWKEEKEELLKSVVDTQKDARLQERVARLEAENTSLAEAAERMKGLEEKTAALEDENNALRERASAGEEAVREAAALREKVKELERQQAEATPALDALERQAAEAREEQRFRQALADHEAQKAEEKKPEPPKGKPAPARKKRKNPLRYEEEFQQEGFVSFFEKKE